MAQVRVALIGNPNTGKSTLFNALSGLRQHVGNYPGVTVEMSTGRFAHAGTEFEVLDLPGTYSLAPRSPDEMVAVELLLGRRAELPRPDVILSVVDASNLNRHLYLTTQLMELGIPVVLAVNMVDVAKSQGIVVDPMKLAEGTGLRVVAIQANKGAGLEGLKAALLEAVGQAAPTGGPKLPDLFEAESAALGAELHEKLPPFLARRLLLDVGGYTEEWLVSASRNGLKAHLAAARDRLSEAGHGVPGVEARTRYAWIRTATAKAVTAPAVRTVTWSDKIDRVLTHRLWGTLVFLVAMFVVFQAIFVVAEPLMDLIDQATTWAVGQVEEGMTPGPVRSFLTDGVLKGVGGVLIFLPQILILFAFVAVLEDCGYMARAAFLMDRVMSRCGLSGKSFIPLLSSVACAVPGIMATRVIENRRDRLATIVVAPLMSCSARLPVYSLLIGAFLTVGYSWWVPGLTLFAMYMIGFVTAPLVALALKRTVLRGAPPLFVLELPAYKRPSLVAVGRRMFGAGWAFVRRAGTFILASMAIVWALLYFPDRDAGGSYETRVAELRAEQKHDEANKLKAEWQRNSILGQTGRALEPVFHPLGWDWRLGVSAMASFPAREVIVGTLGIIYERGDVDAGDDEQRQQLGEAIRDDWEKDPIRSKYRVPVALSVMVFFALCCQCASTLAVIRRETKSWAWPAFTFAYMTVLAYIGAFVTFQVGRIIVDFVG